MIQDAPKKKKKKISNFAIDHKIQFSKIPIENLIANFSSKYV